MASQRSNPDGNRSGGTGSRLDGRPKGTIIIIGGHEDKDGKGGRKILSEVARRAKTRKGPLLIVAVASQLPEEVAKSYVSVFEELGVERVEVLGLRSRDDAHDQSMAKRVAAASAVFFTGGDQLRITSQVGDSPFFENLIHIFQQGATIAGTSAGAAAMPETMLISGPSDESSKISAIGMAPGLGMLQGVVVDSHFAERGRFGRLLGAVAQNPKNLGLGLDENSCVVVEGDGLFSVLGTGAVYVVDGSDVTYSSLSDQSPEGIVSIFNVRLHVLREGDRFDLNRRQPIIPEERESAAA